VTLFVRSVVETHSHLFYRFFLAALCTLVISISTAARAATNNGCAASLGGNRSIETIAAEVKSVWNWIRSRPTKITDQTLRNRIYVQGLPTREQVSYRVLTPAEVEQTTFRHYFPTQVRDTILKTKELIAGSTSFVLNEYAYGDLTGVFLTVPKVNEAMTVGTDQTNWIDVKIDSRIMVVRLSEDIFFVPGNPSAPQWLREKIREGTAPESAGRHLLSKGEATAIPIKIIRVSERVTHPELQGDLLFSDLTSDPNLRPIFAADAGVKELYTIETHVRRVLDVLEDQWTHYKNKMPEIPGVNLPRVLSAIAILHDMGKPQALREHNVNKHHEYTAPILQKVMRSRGFSEKEIALAEALVSHDNLGELINGGLTAKQARTRLVKLSGRVGLPLETFFELQSFFYLIDASSYYSLRLENFEVVDGVVVIKSPKYERLRELIKQK